VPVFLEPREDALVGLLLQSGKVAGFLVHSPVRADHGRSGSR
jgi:hypothetical protein